MKRRLQSNDSAKNKVIRVEGSQREEGSQKEEEKGPQEEGLNLSLSQQMQGSLSQIEEGAECVGCRKHRADLRKEIALRLRDGREATRSKERMEMLLSKALDNANCHMKEVENLRRVNKELMKEVVLYKITITELNTILEKLKNK